MANAELQLQEMFARMNGQNGASNQSGPAPGATPPGGNHANYQPSVSSPIFSPSPNGFEPRHSSAILSPNLSAANSPQPQPQPTHAAQSSQQQSATLLNLLRQNRSTSQQSIPPYQRQPFRSQSSAGHPAQPRQVSVSDLAAGFASSPPAPQAAPATSRPAVRSEHTASENPQDLLLRLLNQPKPPQTERAHSFAPAPIATHVPETAVDGRGHYEPAGSKEESAPDQQANHTAKSPMRVFGSEGPEASLFQPEGPAKPMFTYVNPFDKLEEASPRKRTPVSRGPATPAPKMEILKPKHGLESSALSSDEKDQPSHKSRKLSPAPAGHAHATVAEAVSSLKHQVDKQVEDALARAEMKSEPQVANIAIRSSAKVSSETTNEAAAKIKEPEAKKSSPPAPEEAAKASAPEAQTQHVSEGAEDVADDWENAEAEVSAATKDETVTVYVLPMRPFVSITLDNMPWPKTVFLPDLFMDIARLKKEFDQIDRSLVSASKNFIVWALAKKGGFRIIKQENGQYRQVFENHNERIFNIAICTAGDKATDETESILGIGVNGSVFRTSLDATREDQFSDYLDARGLVLPPCPAQDDNTSGGQLKTRAKPSSRHPEFFAVGRGRSIHIIWPKIAADYIQGGKGVCQTEKYFQERSLKIHTGKAGKDFTFSEDDTVIVSLDKAGRMRFWDIRPLIEPELGMPRAAPRQVEVSETLLEFHTTSPTAKSWPTSVFFFDKEKPFNSCIALRYVMVGMKQNHSFQLWDLGLGRAVQEINLPHEKESDAICSVAYHPKSSIMAVAHPTRNSIFFVHVSCPRYNLPVMNQATYIGRLAAKDRSLPPVNATAIMSSISEYSFASKGQIRSLHMLNEPASPVEGEEGDHADDAALFELYVMHSKGVCAIRIRRSDLGLKKEGAPLQPKQAEEEGLISISPLKAVSPGADDSSTSGEAIKSSSERSARETIKKESSNASRQSMTPEAAMRASTLAKVESKQDAARVAIINGSEKPEKKKKKRSTADSAAASQTSSAPRATPGSYAQAAQAAAPPKSPAPPETSAAEPKTSESELIELMKKFTSQQPASSIAATPEFDTTKLKDVVKNEVTQVLKTQMDALYKRMDDDRRATQASSAAQQQAVLRLVSSTLTENVEAVISKMVEDNTRDVLLPKMLETMSATVEKTITANLKSVMGDQLAKSLPDTVVKALRNPQVLQALSSAVTKQVTAPMQDIVATSTASAVNAAVPVLSNMIEKKVIGQLQQAQKQREADSAKISQLTNAVDSLTETLRSMAAAQSDIQAQLVQLQQGLPSSAQHGALVLGSPEPDRAAAPPQLTAEQIENEAIINLMNDGQFGEGTMRWLQSNRTSELFNTIFVRYDPSFLQHVSPLLNLSTGTVVTEHLDQNLSQRLMWLDTVLNNVNPHEREIRDVFPRIMEILTTRLTSAYIQLNENSPNNQLLRTISLLIRKVNELARIAASQG